VNVRVRWLRHIVDGRPLTMPLRAYSSLIRSMSASEVTVRTKTPRISS